MFVKGIERKILQFLMMIVIHQLLMKQEKHPSKLTELIQPYYSKGNHPPYGVAAVCLYQC